MRGVGQGGDRDNREDAAVAKDLGNPAEGAEACSHWLNLCSKG